MALAQAKRTHRIGDQPGTHFKFPVAADAVIWEGALIVANAAGFALPLAADTNNGRLIGFAKESVDATGLDDGDVGVDVTRDTVYEEVALSGAAQADAGDAIYATDDNTYTKTSTTATLLGKIVRLMAAGRVVIKLQPDL
jgi:hypothetical protein